MSKEGMFLDGERLSVTNAVSEQKPAVKTSRRVSKPKIFSDCITYDDRGRRKCFEDRRSSISSNEKQSKNTVKISSKTQLNNSNDSKNEIDNMAKVKLISSLTMDKTESKVKNHNKGNYKRTITTLETTVQKSMIVNNEEMRNDVAPINDTSYSTLQNLKKSTNKQTKVNQSKVVNNKLTKDHDGIENKAALLPDYTNNSSNSNTIPVQEIQVIKKGRGRPRKSLIVDKTCETNSSNSKPKNESPINILVDDIDKKNTILKELDRTKSTEQIEANLEELNDKELKDEECSKKHAYRRKRGGCRGGRRGRPSIQTAITSYLSKVPESNEEQIKCETSNGKISKISNTSEIVCGKCSEKMSKDQWIKHNLQKHNNMSWREGDPVPDYESNEKLWRSVLTVAHKQRKGSLICDKCCTTKRSVIGFISHYQFCGKTDEERQAMKWICPQCFSVFMPSSQDVHERMHRDMQRQNEILPTQISVDNSECNGKGKRKAAEKAATKISEFTSLVKDENESVSKKIKLTVASMKDFIEPQRKTNSIPNVWRSAWIKALEVKEKAQCRQPGCTFSTESLNEICEHYANCKFKPHPTFTCKICKYLTESLKGMKKHVKEQHSNELNLENDSDFHASESSDESDVDDNGSVETVRKRKTLSLQLSQAEKVSKYDVPAAFLRNEQYCREGNNKKTFIPALRWTLKFELNNYCLSLFECFKPNNFTLLANKQADEYIPKLSLSMRFKNAKNSTTFNVEKLNVEKTEWKVWYRFESSVVNGFPTFFVGGPIWAIAWLPIPTILYSKNVRQYIALSTHSKMNDSFTMATSYKFKNIIQIWDIGHLEHSLSHIPQCPQLAYAIAHDKGTIWCMEWCPSGAYDNSDVINNKEQTLNSNCRMGLLAVASSDGCVHIYSMPFPEKMDFKKTYENRLPIYKTNPVITLQINKLLHEQSKNNWQCTTLNWSKTHGHDTIAAGFTNGYVALWNLNTKSPLLVTKHDDTLIITSYRHFYAHKQAVTGITIIPWKGKRFLSTVSIDRCSKFWDLEDVTNCVSVVKKGMAVSSAWMSHWPNICTSYDDVLGLAHTVTYMISLREPYNKAYPLLPTNSPSYGLAVSDYANGICHGTSAGELVAIFPFQMMYSRDMDKLSKKRWLVSSIEVVDLSTKKLPNNIVETGDDSKISNLKEYNYMPETYEECSKRFGMIFRDDINNSKKNRANKKNRKNPLNTDTMKSVPIEQYNFTSINRISWNPNAHSYLWVALGYQSGFVRILHFKSMSMQNSIMKLLPDHTKTILENKKDISSTT